MHGTAVNELVRAFLQSPHAQTQLIAATHETCLLTAELLRRDQIWFVQKNDSAGSELYSLLEFRTDPAHPAAGNTCRCRDYLSGRYGAVPQISRPEPFLGAAGSPTTVSENLPH